MPIEHGNFKFPQRQRDHGLPRNSPAQSSAQAHPASNSQSGSEESTSGTVLSSASNTLISGGQFTAAANVNRNVTINIGATEDLKFIPQTQTENCHSRQTAYRSRKRRRTQMQLQQDPTPTRGSRGNQIYEWHLREKGRGHPLWIPQANMVLPIPYRAQGGRIGDVGIFTDDGAFDFLFNICVPRDDPINPDELPINFVHIHPSINPIDIRKFAEFGPTSYLASSSITESRTAEQGSGLIFESSASEGAILTMPEGAYSENLSNVSRVQEFIATHAEDWYKFVNGPRGREAQNGDLRVVVGCDKTTSWGMATFTNSSMSQGTNFRLKFSAFEGQPSSQHNAGNNYMWEHSSSGLAELRVGPGRDENKELGETNSNRLRNQTLFLRTLNVMLSKHAWEEIFPQKVVVKDENTSHQDQSDLPSSWSSHSHPPENLPFRGHHSNDLHPSKIINQYLLEQNPLARVAVTHDRDWSGVIMDLSLPDSSQMISAILSMNDVVLDNDTGLVFLELKENQQNGMSSNEGKLAELIESIKNGSLTLDQYLFGFHCLLQDFCKALRSGSTNQPTFALSSLMGHPERPLSLDELLNMCNGGFHVQGSTQRQSIVSLRAELTLLSSQHADRSSCLLRLADALSRRYYQWTQRDDLEEAIWSYKEALSLLPSSHYRYLETLLGLCSSLYQRFYLLGHEDDLKDLLRSLELKYDMFNVRRSLLASVKAQLETHPCDEVVCAPDPDMRGKPDDFDPTTMGKDNVQGSDDRKDSIVESFTQPSRFPALAETPVDKYALLVDGVQSSHYKKKTPSTSSSHYKKKTLSTSRNARGRGSYNVACNVCAGKKVKCDGIKPVCQSCQSQGRQKECTWDKNPFRKPRSEAYVEALHKQVENLRKSAAEMRDYTDYLESLLMDQSTIDFRASRPTDLDVLMGQPEDDLDCITGAEDQGSDDENHANLMAICIPPQSLQVEPFTRFPDLKNLDDTYVLFVEGVPPSHCNPAFDWSRHLAPNAALDRRSHDKALDLLFKFHTSWCLRIIPDLFLRDMYRALKMPPTQTPPKTPHYSPMLHNALVALALAFMDEPLKDLKTRQCYAIHAKSYIEAECRKPNLSGVHALSVLGSFHSSQGDQNLGYMYFGMSARMSQTLSLNIDFSEWVKLGMMDETERLDRHWSSWTNFTQDVCWSLYVGRDFSVTEPVGAKAIPMPHIDSEFDKINWFYPPAKIGPQPNNLTKTFEATCRLLMIARHIMDFLNGLPVKAGSRPLILDTLIGNIDVELNMWKNSLTEDLDITPRSLLTATPHKLMLHLAYWWLFILLHRPFFQRKSKPIRNTDREIDHVKLCRRAAERIMELLSTWRTLYTLRYCPVTLIQTAFSAGTVYLLIAMQASSGARTADKELRHSLDQEILLQQYFQEVGLSWNCATKVSHTLRNLSKEHVRPLLDDLDRKNIPKGPAGLHFLPDIPDEEEEGWAHHIQPSPSSLSRNHRVRGHLGMGGQTLPKEPASVGLRSEADTLNCPFGAAFLNQGSASSSLGDRVPSSSSSSSSSHGDNDSMDLDNATWTQSFVS